ncbi:hypothetical protein CANTEDRAFT_127665, partial [Yamadazyma tenuis ATCC 10573]
MNSSGRWDRSPPFPEPTTDISDVNHVYNSANGSGIHSVDVSYNPNQTPQHELQTQDAIPESELIDSITSANVSERQNPFLDDQDNYHSVEVNDEESTNKSDILEEPTMEQIQQVYYARGLKEIESLDLHDLSPLANWKLSSLKQGFGLAQLRDDTPNMYWQSDGSNGTNNSNSSNNGAITNNQLSNPHSITIQFSKRVSLERISLFTNY